MPLQRCSTQKKISNYNLLKCYLELIKTQKKSTNVKINHSRNTFAIVWTKEWRERHQRRSFSFFFWVNFHWIDKDNRKFICYRPMVWCLPFSTKEGDVLLTNATLNFQSSLLGSDSDASSWSIPWCTNDVGGRNRNTVTLIDHLELMSRRVCCFKWCRNNELLADTNSV